MARWPLNAFLTQIGAGGTLTVNAGGRLYLYEQGTTDEAEVWDAKVGGEVITQPLVPDADGSFPEHWIEDDRDYDRAIVGDALNPIQNWRVRKGVRRVIYPRDYGAAEDETSDETAALQDCIDDALTAENVTIALAPGCTYNVDSEPRTDRGGNCILSIYKGINSKSGVTLEAADWPQFTLNAAYQGEAMSPRAIIKTSRTGDVYDPDYGPPSVFGGATEEQGGLVVESPSGMDVSNWCGAVRFRNIAVQVPLDPEIAGIDALCWGGFSQEHGVVVAGEGGDATTPATHAHAFGIRWPYRWSEGVLWNQQSHVHQFYVGNAFRVSDHWISTSGWVFRCTIGLGFENRGETLAGAYGMKLVYHYQAQCPYHIAGWHPETGVTDVPWDIYFEAGSSLITELGNAPWNVTAYWQDTNNKLNGELSLHHFAGLAVASAAQVPPTIVGGQKLRARMIKASVPTIASATTLTVPTWADVVKVSGSTTITSITASYASRRLTLIWAPGATFNITDGSNLRVVGDITTFTEDDSVTLTCDGTNWFVAGGKTEGTSAPRTVTSSVDLSAVTSVSTVGFVTDPPPAGDPETRLWTKGSALVTRDPRDYLAVGFNSFVFSSAWLEGLGGDGVDRDTIFANIATFRSRAPNAKLYLGVYVNSTLAITDQWGGISYDWMNASAWSSIVLPAFTQFREDAETYGFDGIALDEELYHPGLQQNRGWRWDYYGTSTEAAKRAAVLARGELIGEALAGMPEPALIYNHAWAGSLEALRQTQDGVTPNPNYSATALVWKEWHNGLDAGGLDFVYTDSDVYKDMSAPLPPGPFASWTAAAANQKSSLTSHWGAGHGDRWQPFIWITDGPNTIQAKAAGQPYSNIWDRTRDTAYINTQISQCRAASPDGHLTVYDYGGPDPAANYTPFNL